MCIDGTAKFEEEISDQNIGCTNDPGNNDRNKQALINAMGSFEEIRGINTALYNLNIPVLILSVQKGRRGHIRELNEKIGALPEIEGTKMILYVEHTVNVQDLTVALWRFCNNLDPKRDSMLIRRESSSNPANMVSCMGLDGTIKTKEFDNFLRDWPNIIVSDEQTIEAVDKKWYSLGIGAFISSPSLKFKDQIYGKEAVVQY
jgi:4-hydroxy-3-polyprenylbenzoate decarboxylase